MYATTKMVKMALSAIIRQAMPTRPFDKDDGATPSGVGLATALFMVAIFGVSHIPVVRKIMALADPFFDARTPISIRPWPLGQTIMRQSLYARICVFFLILVNQFQVALADLVHHPVQLGVF